MMAESDEHERLLQERLQRLVAPPEPPGFADELWERVQAAEHAAAQPLAADEHRARGRGGRRGCGCDGACGDALVRAHERRHRRDAVVFNARVGTTAEHSGRRQRGHVEDACGWGHSAGPSTRRCRAFSYRRSRLPPPRDSFTVDRAVCKTSKRQVPLAPAGLPANPVVTPTFAGSWGNICVIADRASANHTLVRVRVTVKNGVPVRGELAVRDEETNKPVAYVVWTPTRLASYSLATCIPG